MSEHLSVRISSGSSIGLEDGLFYTFDPADAEEQSWAGPFPTMESLNEDLRETIEANYRAALEHALG